MSRFALGVFVACLLASSTSFAGGKKGKATPAAAKKPPAGQPVGAPDKKTPTPPAGSSDQQADASATPPTRGPTRIDFDDRLIQGQTNKSGAVYLYDRKELKTKSMVKKRDSFRDEIIGSLYDS
ncbi:MAG: hypothetical protein QM723_29640 [Myxococcaceae bacterium]